MYKTKKYLRKTHRYLGLTIGIQFLAWTVSGLYFSWTDIDEIHGDHFLQLEKAPPSFSNLIGLEALHTPIHEIDLIAIGNAPYYWINDTALYDAQTGQPLDEISEAQAMAIASAHVIPSLQATGITKITETDAHHEYRGRPLPAYVISYDHPENIKAYVAAKSGAFQRVRHESWRWFDFLWMGHTMDYQGRDDFNNFLLRAFSLFGLFTVMSGFVLWGISSPTLRKLRAKF
jgi:hypothetical protein